MPELEGVGALSLADLRGDIVVVNFWASWCVACREEHAALMPPPPNYRAVGVTFVGVQEGPDSATGFLDELGRGGPNYRYVT